MCFGIPVEVVFTLTAANTLLSRPRCSWALHKAWSWRWFGCANPALVFSSANRLKRGSGEGGSPRSAAGAARNLRPGHHRFSRSAVARANACVLTSDTQPAAGPAIQIGRQKPFHARVIRASAGRSNADPATTARENSVAKGLIERISTPSHFFSACKLVAYCGNSGRPA